MPIQLSGGSVIVGGHAVVVGESAATPPTGDHAYYESLIARPDLWLSYSLRDNSQLATYSNSGPPKTQFVTYLPLEDTDPHAQDAAKVLMPWFLDVGAALNLPRNLLTSDVAPGDTTIYLSGLGSITFSNGRSVLIDSEIMTLTASADTVGGSITVSRGQFGTTAASHTTGTLVMRGGNGLQNQVRLPLGTSDGHTYLFTWDVYNTDSMVGTGLTNHKAFQFATGNIGATIWNEVNQKYAGDAMSPADFNDAIHVATAAMRGYMKYPGVSVWEGTQPDGSTRAGPGMTTESPMDPFVGGFNIKPNVWTRWWYRIQQQANNWCYVDVWIADETEGPVQLYDQLPCNIPTDEAHTIGKWWIEFNTSQTAYTKGDPDPLSDPMTVYVRNFVGLVDPPSDISALLVQP